MHQQSADLKTAVALYRRAEGLVGAIKDPEMLSALYFNSGMAYDAMETTGRACPA